MTIREWIRDREISGFPTFSVEEIRLALPHYSEQVIKNDLFRISSQGIIYPVYKGFYVIIPPHYAAKRMVPPIYYIDQLMSYLNKPYYISLLNAAEIHGAAHQRPQKFQSLLFRNQRTIHLFGYTARKFQQIFCYQKILKQE